MTGSSNISAPIVFDLNNNGYTDVVSIDESKIVIQNGQNQYTRIGWIGPEDGILALERNVISWFV